MLSPEIPAHHSAGLGVQERCEVQAANLAVLSCGEEIESVVICYPDIVCVEVVVKSLDIRQALV